MMSFRGSRFRSNYLLSTLRIAYREFEGRASRDMIRIVMNRWRAEGGLEILGRGRDARWRRRAK